MRLRVALVAAVIIFACGGCVRSQRPATTARAAEGATVTTVRLPAPKHPTNPKPCKGTVALTFDDGPGIYTPQVLALLKRWHARSTFFIVGARAKGRPEGFKAIVADGHWVANHTWDHTALSKLSPADQRAQIDRTTKILVELGAPKPKLFRAPFGDSTLEQRAYVKAQGMRQVLWTVDPEDWAGETVPHIRAWTLSHLKDGAVVLLHDGMEDTPPNTIAALPQIIDGLRARGYCTGPVPEDAPEKWGDPGAAGGKNKGEAPPAS